MAPTTHRDVLSTSDARSHLSSIVAGFSTGGSLAEPVVFGPYRKPQAAVISLGLLDRLMPLIEDLVIAERTAARYESDDGTRLSFEELAADAGFEPSRFK